jgi:hypothetical protein
MSQLQFEVPPLSMKKNLILCFHLNELYYQYSHIPEHINVDPIIKVSMQSPWLLFILVSVPYLREGNFHSQEIFKPFLN